MAINVVADPLVVTTTVHGARDQSWAASPLEVTFAYPYAHGILSHNPAAYRNSDLDQIFYVGTVEVALTISGTWLNVAIVAEPLVVTLSIESDTELAGGVWIASPLLVTTSLLDADMVTEAIKQNWVSWSDIGHLDFTVGRGNVAGTRPMDWKGWVYAIRKLADKVVVYGENGVSLMVPKATAWGLSTISRVGVKGRLAVCGIDTEQYSVHYFVDIEGRLCKMSDKLEVLGYEEYLNGMAPSIVCSYDEINHLVYICDGQIGYVYSEKDKGMGRGPANVTGFAVQSGVQYITAPATIGTIPFEICTDIYDLGSRKDKTILEVEFGVDAATEIYAAIDWRKDKTAAFATTPWTRVNPSGRANLPCWGREFRIRAKQLTYEYFELDYIKVTGVLHNYSYLDSFLRGRQV